MSVRPVCVKPMPDPCQTMAGSADMKVLLVAHDKARFGLINSVLASDGHEVTSYSMVWRAGGKANDTRRAAVAEAVRATDAAVLDITDEHDHAQTALVLGMCVILQKRAVMVADAGTDISGWNVQRVLKFAAEDDEAMALFGSALSQELQKSSSETNSEPARPEVFLSYSHRDTEYLERLMVHLRPLERDATIQTWSDRRIRTGERWREEIAEAMDRASAAVLLVSPDFLASDFIMTNELPRLLKKARSEGTQILPLILSNCRFERDPDLSVFQAVNNPRRPLASLPPFEQEMYYDRIAADIEQATRGLTRD